MAVLAPDPTHDAIGDLTRAREAVVDDLRYKIQRAAFAFVGFGQ